MEFDLLNHLSFDEAIAEKVLSFAEKEEIAVLNCAEAVSNRNVNCLKRKSDIFRLAVMLKAAESTHKKYIEKGIPDSIFYDTMDDIRIWCEENSNKGLKNYNWIKNHINFEIFRLGRLQFQFYKAENPTLHYSKLPFKKGDNMLYIHIPRFGRLDFNDCINSLNEAKEFFKRYFPEYNYKGFFCESWLLYADNSKFMSKDSNILKFQNMFDIAYSIHYENQTYDRVFGLEHLPVFRSQIKALPEETSLQKSAKEFKLAKGKFGIGIATVKSEYI